MRSTMVMAMAMCGALLLALAAGCGPRDPDSGKVSDDGRKETRSIEAADTVGYEGKAIRKKVDHALDLNDQRTDELDKAIQKESQ